MKNDVAIILATMCFLQACYYAITGLAVALCTAAFNAGGGLGAVTIRTALLCQPAGTPVRSQAVVLVAKCLTLFPMTAVVGLSVDNVSVVGDFVMTLFGIHFLVCWTCFGFPPAVWWISTGVEVALLLTVSEVAVARRLKDELFGAAERIERPQDAV